MVHKLECKVVGVDISANMRALACSLVNSPYFVTLDPLMFDELLWREYVFDAAIAVWALQHCIDLKKAALRLSGSLASGGKLILVNNNIRCLPIPNGEWVTDGLDVNEVLCGVGFKEIDRGLLDPKIAPGWMQHNTYWSVMEIMS